jgi:hypothetical protein
MCALFRLYTCTFPQQENLSGVAKFLMFNSQKLFHTEIAGVRHADMYIP